MGNEVSEIAADAIVSATVEEGNPDMDALADVVEESLTCPNVNVDDVIESVLPEDADPDEYTYYDEDEDYEGGGWEYDAPIEEEPVSEAYDQGDEYYDTEVDSNDLAEGNEDVLDSPEVSAEEEESGAEYADDLDEWDDVELGETEDGLFDEDINGLRSEAGLFGEGGLDIYDGVDPMEPIDWEVEEFYDYDVDELTTATDIELTSLGYPPEPIPGTTTEDIMFSVEMMNEYTVPPETFSPAMAQAFNDGASDLLETQNEMVDSIRDMRQSLM
ncbi:classical arabinogalac6 [Gracilaria domingensis]|nr:classical arabinogalac6 [Gracilaria domingensis]